MCRWLAYSPLMTKAIPRNSGGAPKGRRTRRHNPMTLAAMKRKRDMSPLARGVLLLANAQPVPVGGPCSGRFRKVVSMTPNPLYSPARRARITPCGRSSSVCWRPSGCWPARLRRLRRCCPPRPKTRWQATSPSSCSSSSRCCSSSCSGWCMSSRRRSRTSGTIRSSRPSRPCACCRSCSAGCSGRWPGCGRTRSRSATNWRTEPTSIPTTSRSTAFPTGQPHRRYTGARGRARGTRRAGQ